MGFVVDCEKIAPEREVHRFPVTGKRYRKAAVSCWFTASGKSLPQLVKYQDEQGILHTLRDIQIIKTRQEHFAGILSQRYDCRVQQDDHYMDFILIYFPEANLWNMAL